MAIEVKCDGCGHVLHLPDSSAGKKGKCPKCGSIVVVLAVASDETWRDIQLLQDERAVRKKSEKNALCGPPEYFGLGFCALVHFLAAFICVFGGLAQMDASDKTLAVILIGSGIASLTVGFVLLAIRDIARNTWRAGAGATSANTEKATSPDVPRPNQNSTPL